MTAANTSIGPQAASLPEEIRVVNVGLDVFADAVRAQKAHAIDLPWRIPAGGDERLIEVLTRLYGSSSESIERANAVVLERLDGSKPVLVAVARAGEVVPEMDERTILHPGPPLDWEDFCDPLRRSVRAAVMAEGWASSPEEAERFVAGGSAPLDAANHHATVVPMATALGPGAPVVVVENPQGGNRAFSALNQGPGAVAWFGVESDEAVDRLRWLSEVGGPLLAEVVAASDPVDLMSTAAQGLQMGDDVHMRCQATTNLLVRNLLPHLVGLEDPKRVELAAFLSANHLFFLNLAMAAAKATADWAREVEGSSIVTGMARNGTTFGVRLGGDGDHWFTAPAPAVEQALFHAGFGPDDAAPDIGDSAVLELVGLGGAAAAASPAVAAFVGGSMANAIEKTDAMDTMCAGRSTRFKIPFLNGRGSPIGVDARKVVELGLTPSINTGILHSSSGQGQIGAGVAHAPIECFSAALLALDEKLR